MSLVFPGFIFSAPTSGPPPLFPPTTHLLEAWLSDTGVFEAGTGVDSWLGAHAGLDAKQSNDAKRPTYTLASLGGQPTLDFNGTSDFLSLSSGLASTGSDHTTFIVMTHTNAASQNFFDFGTGRFAMRIGTPAGTVEAFDVANRQVGVIAGGTRVLTYRQSGTTFSAYNGSTLIGSIASSGNALGGTAAMGANFLGTGAYSTAKIAAIMVYNAALDATARGNVLAFTTAKYGTP